MKAIPNIVFRRVFALAVGCSLPLGGFAECSSTFDVESRDEVYFYASDVLQQVVLNPIFRGVAAWAAAAVGIAESFETGCGTIDLLGVTISGKPGDQSSVDVAAVVAMSAERIMEFTRKGVTWNNIAQAFVPKITPCNRKPREYTEHLGGSTTLYVMHAGTGPYRKKICRATYHTCQTVVVENPTTNAIEVPITVHGAVWTAGSFALDERTYGRARLRAWGGVAGELFDEKIEVRAADIFPTGDGIDYKRTFIVAPGRGRHVAQIELFAESLTEVQAKAGGLFSSIACSATAGVDFPNSIEIGNFTGKDRGRLPAGVMVYSVDAPDKPLVDTRPVITMSARLNGTNHFHVGALAGSACSLQASPDLHTWTTLLTTNLTTSTFDYVDRGSAQLGRRFYRVKTP